MDGPHLQIFQQQLVREPLSFIQEVVIIFTQAEVPILGHFGDIQFLLILGIQTTQLQIS